MNNKNISNSNNSNNNTLQYFRSDDSDSDDQKANNQYHKKKLSSSCILENKLENYETDLILPKPIPLMKKTKSFLEPIRCIYNYPFKKLIEFDGIDKVDTAEIIPKRTKSKKNSTIEQQQQQYNNNNNNHQYQQQQQHQHHHQATEHDKLEDYFSDKEKIVYMRDNNNSNHHFNGNYFNIKKYLKMNDGSISLKDKKNTIELDSMSNNDLKDDKYRDYFYQPKNSEDKTLVFESRFESGNLSIVSKVSDTEYNLILQNDINTNGYIQWFFFEMNNTTKNMNIKFNILNFIKSDSIFNHGMKILIYSLKEYNAKNIGWFRGGEKIAYYKNNIIRETKQSNIPKSYRTLSFEYKFIYDDDKVYFAYSYPYTYSDLKHYLEKLEDDQYVSKIMIRAPLCRTIAGNMCEVLTISNHNQIEQKRKKRCILLISRIHPGETVCSYTIKGVIDYLTSNKEEANLLRDHFIFKIIPMINPDGVIHGNYRCDLAGSDLNRRWRKPSSLIYPTIYAARKLIENIKHKYKIALFCDFHGHSRKFNTFLYACSNPNNPYKSREFPFIMSRLCPTFSYRDCSFATHQEKRRTSRVTLFEEFKTLTSFCLETSFFGSSKTKKHFTRQDLEQIGQKFCESLIIYFAISPKQPEIQTKMLNKDNVFVQNEILVREFKTLENYEADIPLKNSLLEELYADEKNFAFGLEERISDSDSESSYDGLENENLMKYIPIIKKKKDKKAKKLKEKSNLNINTQLSIAIPPKIQEVSLKRKITNRQEHSLSPLINKEFPDVFCEKMLNCKYISVSTPIHSFKPVLENQIKLISNHNTSLNFINGNNLSKSVLHPHPNQHHYHHHCNCHEILSSNNKINKSHSSRFEKLPSLIIHDPLGQNHGYIKNSIRKNIIERDSNNAKLRLRKRSEINIDDYFRIQDYIESNVTTIHQCYNKNTPPELYSPHPIIKKDKIHIVKEPIMPKPFKAEFKGIHAPVNPNPKINTNNNNNTSKSRSRVLSLRRQQQGLLDPLDTKDQNERLRRIRLIANSTHSSKNNILENSTNQSNNLSIRYENPMKISKLDNIPYDKYSKLRIQANLSLDSGINDIPYMNGFTEKVKPSTIKKDTLSNIKKYVMKHYTNRSLHITDRDFDRTLLNIPPQPLSSSLIQDIFRNDAHHHESNNTKPINTSFNIKSQYQVDYDSDHSYNMNNNTNYGSLVGGGGVGGSFGGSLVGSLVGSLGVNLGGGGDLYGIGVNSPRDGGSGSNFSGYNNGNSPGNGSNSSVLNEYSNRQRTLPKMSVFDKPDVNVDQLIDMKTRFIRQCQ